MRSLVLVAWVASACTPDYRSGDLQCSIPDRRCPDGFHCAGDDTCWQDGTDPDLAFAPDLGSGDLAQPDDLSEADATEVDGIVAICGWTMAPTNFDPCGLPTSAGDWTVSSNGNYNTDTGTGSGGPTGITFTQGGVMTRLVHVGQFTVQPNITLTLAGSLPLIIVAETATVTGVIVVQSGIDPTQCSPPGVPGAGATCGAGGGGGGFGSTGGFGGNCTGGLSFGQGLVTGDATLAPLRGGCSGRPGAVSGGLSSLMSGYGGGAVQIAARVSLSMAGIINANGTNASPGQSASTGCSGGGCSSGGGGGGSGGAVFLESANLIVAGSGRICANGGGGAGGGAPGPSATTAGPAGVQSCDDNGPPGGPGGNSPTGIGGAGGHGGYGSIPAGGNGNPVSSGAASGGGAGGGVGRIRLRAANSAPIASGAIISPAPTN